MFSNHLTSKGVSTLFDNIIDLNFLNEIDLSGNDFDDECFPSVANFIKCSKSTKLRLILDGYENYAWGWDQEYFNHFKSYGLGGKVTDKAIEILHPVMIGNTSIQQIILSRHLGITDTSAELLKDIAKQSAVQMDLRWTSIDQVKLVELDELFGIPIEHRLIPISSDSKSAAKIQ